MAKVRAAILDLSSARARAGLLADPRAGLDVLDDFALPLRVAIRKTEKGLFISAGEEAAPLVEDAQTLIFDELNAHMPRVDDGELQEQLLTALWAMLCERLAGRGWLDRPGQCAAYVVTQAGWGPAVLERFRGVAAADGRLRLVAFPNEAAALIIGALEDAEVNQALSNLSARGPATGCLVVAADDAQAVVCCFDYGSDGERERRIVIRDFFRAKYGALSDELYNRDWSRAISGLILFESLGLAAPARKAVEGMLQGAAGAVVRRTLAPAALHDLKLIGGATIARCSMAEGGPTRFAIEAAYHIGVQTSARQFHPILTRPQMEAAAEFPFTAEQRFKLKGRPGNEMRLNAYCGYSTRVAEATYLGHFTLSQAELNRLQSSKEAAISASVRMDSPGSAEVTLSLLPDNRTIGSQYFLLPGLMG